MILKDYSKKFKDIPKTYGGGHLISKLKSSEYPAVKSLASTIEDIEKKPIILDEEDAVNNTIKSIREIRNILSHDQLYIIIIFDIKKEIL